MNNGEEFIRRIHDNITGHIKQLTYEEWLEGAESFILEARTLIRRAKINTSLNTFGRTFYLGKAERKLALAEECLSRAMIERDINDFF
jgi:hypothetical protein